jgi:hypothetical protein
VRRTSSACTRCVTHRCVAQGERRAAGRAGIRVGGAAAFAGIRVLAGPLCVDVVEFFVRSTTPCKTQRPRGVLYVFPSSLAVARRALRHEMKNNDIKYHEHVTSGPQKHPSPSSIASKSDRFSPLLPIVASRLVESLSISLLKLSP